MSTGSKSVRALPLDRLVGSRWVLPLRALPYVAPATLRPGIVARSLVGHDERGALDAYSLTGELRQLAHRSPAEFLHCLHDIEALEESMPVSSFVSCLPPGVVTPLDQAQQLHLHVYACLVNLNIDEVGFDTWDEEPAVPTVAWDLIFEGFPSSFVEQRELFRANSVTPKEERLVHYIDELIECAKCAGVVVDKSSLPGTKKQFREALKLLATSQRPLPILADSTIDGYFKRLGLRWPQGRPAGKDNVWLRVIPKLGGK